MQTTVDSTIIIGEEVTLINAGQPKPAQSHGLDTLFAYHTPEKLAEHILQNEKQVGLKDIDVQRRRAQDVSDGAFIGPLVGNKIVQILNNKQGVQKDLVEGLLDRWHGLVKALEHSDRLEFHPGG